MRIFFLTLFCCSLLLPCFALAPITDANLTKAVNYGISGKQDNLTLRQFLQPWVIPEELQKNPFRRRESVVLYTPYLLAAIHARDQIAEQKLPDLAEIRENVAEYEGITLIGAVLNCPIMLEKDAFKVRLLQNEKTIEPYAVTFLAGSTIDMEEETEKSAGIRQGKADVSGKTAEKPKVAVAKVLIAIVYSLSFKKYPSSHCIPAFQGLPVCLFLVLFSEACRLSASHRLLSQLQSGTLF